MPTKKSEPGDEGYQLAGEELKQIANCLAYLIINGEQFKGRPQKELIQILANLGFDRQAIAGILQTTPETVSVRLSELKSSSKQATKKSVEGKDGKNQATSAG